MIDKIKKRPVPAVIALVTAIALAAALIIPAAQRGMPSGTVEVVEELVSAAVENGTITRELISGGSVADCGSLDITLAGDISLESWEVSDGDFVKAGQLLARVDRVSVLRALEELNELTHSLDAALETSRADTVSTAISAPAAGRVKAVYASAGTSVTQTMAENGALMLLSLDGLMAVDIAADGLRDGSSVNVTLDSGAEYSGTVSAISDGTATVTISDAEAMPGENAVISAGGAELGRGVLYVHQALTVTGYTGTVARVNAALNSPVSSGQTLITLSDSAYTGRYETLLSQHHELEAQIQALFAAYESGGIYAPQDGRISALDESLVSEAASSDFSAAAPLSYNGSMTGGIKLLSAVSLRRSAVSLLTYTDGSNTGSGADADVPAEPSPSPSPTPETDGTRIGRVTDVADNGDGTALITITCTDGSRLTVSTAELDGKTGDIDPSAIKTGDIIALTFENGTLVSATVYQSGGDTPGGDVPGGDTPGGGQGGGQGGAGMASAGTGSSEEQTDYTASETALCTLTPYNTAELVISVDELDIGKLSVGQSAAVTLDALPGQSFDGTVTVIDPVGTNDGGNTKYSVTVSIARSEDMYTGMNASVRITLDSTQDVPVIPAAALNEDVSGVYVYTACDSRSGELSAPVYVTTGVSDGEQVQILSGLSAGDSYFYRRADTLRYTFSR